ncbi:hypothetical protein FGADI_7382 [Fusarium gaditjirri]|uniref:Adenylosuccinate lyase C-terminal domain-containing protein n=1 Tax=Fusarium gaditjirri TaxID=282569 RepID=A0A8H4T584_9HYPO|nr:hypothetical protein FGADI_7382 [Fusarium gaditjirri]
MNIVFVVFASLAIASDGQILTKGSRAQYLLDITFYGPTIFPILFAAIVGRALKALATWELQRGSTIGHVETLSSSTTLIGAIVTQIQLRNLNLVAIALIVLWALSPVGGQASLRILRVGTRITKTNHQFHALDPESAWEAGSSTSYPILAHALFTSSLITTKKLYNKPQDSWGNLRIPMVEAFDDYQSHAWIKIPDNATEVIFSSLIGVPVNPGLPSEPTILTLNTSYMYLDCPTFNTSPRELDQWQQDKPLPWTNFTADHPLLENPNDTWAHYYTLLGDSGPIVYKGFQIALSTCLGICSHRLVPREARRVIWESASRDTFAHIDCGLHTTHVDVRYSCVGASCSPIEVRLSPYKPDASHSTGDGNLHDPWNNRNFTGFDKGYSNAPINFLSTMASAFRMRSAGDMVPLLGFILSPNDTMAAPPDRVFYEDVTSIGKAKFQERLSQLFNTLFLAGIQPSAITGAMPVTERLPFTAISTITAETRITDDIIECNKAWFAIMLVISIIVLVISFCGAFLRAITLVPDVLGTLSMITLDNQCDKELRKASMLDGLERSRLLKKAHMMLVAAKAIMVENPIRYSGLSDEGQIWPLKLGGDMPDMEVLREAEKPGSRNLASLLETFLGSTSNLPADSIATDSLDAKFALFGASKQKRNPISSEIILAKSKIFRAQAGLVLEGMVSDFERVSGPWHLEWAAVLVAFISGVGSLHQANFALSGLQVNSGAMKANLESTRGLIIAEAVMMKLAEFIGRQEAHEVVYGACVSAIEGNLSLIESLQKIEQVAKHLKTEQLTSLVDPAQYLGCCQLMVDELLRLRTTKL